MSALVITAALSTGLTGLVAGALLFGSLVVSRAERDMDERSWLRLHQAMNRTADPLMPLLTVAATAATVGFTAAAVGSGHGAVAPAALAVLGNVTAIVSSVSVNVPLNKRIDSWPDAAPPGDLAAVRHRWTRFHILRTIASVLAFACVIWAAAALAV